MSDSFDVIVIGGGPAGYPAAIRAGQLGMTAACVDKRGPGQFGGTCLNIGCIPSKALLYASELYDEAAGEKFAKLGIKAQVSVDLPAMMAHKTKVVGELTKGVEFLFKKNKVEGIVGEARIVSPGQVAVKLPDGSTRTLTAKNIVIATGSDVMPLPGVTVDEETIVSSTGALSLKSVPKRLLVVGGDRHSRAPDDDLLGGRLLDRGVWGEVQEQREQRDGHAARSQPGRIGHRRAARQGAHECAAGCRIPCQAPDSTSWMNLRMIAWKPSASSM